MNTDRVTDTYEANPKRMKRLYEKYPFLNHYRPPEENPVQWNMLTPGDMVDLFIKLYGRSRSVYYAEVFPRLHACQHGWDPREHPDQQSRRLDDVPEWVYRHLISEIKMA